MKQLDVVDYPTYMVAMNAMPPVPALWGEGWRDEWQRRIEQTEPWFLTWMSHQQRDAYWRYGSAREDIEKITAATMIVGGWADGYTNIALRSFPRMQAPVRLLLGPWSHGSPESCRPGPNIDFMAEMLRWFDRWLKGIDNGIDREPPIVVYQQRSTLPDPLRSDVRGEWRFEPTWPPERLRPTPYALQDAEPGGLADGAGSTDTLPVDGSVGETAWISCAGGLPWGQSADQRPDEARSLTYTWAPLAEELELFGHPVLRVRVTCDRPTAYLSAKITDVFPDGTSSLVVRGMTNLAYRGPDAAPVALQPGEPIELELELEAIAWTVEAGHRLRLDLAGADWPNAWPPPHAATLTIDRSTAQLELPVLDGPPPITEAPPLRTLTDHQHGTESTEDDWWRWEMDDDGSGMRVARTGYGGSAELDGARSPVSGPVRGRGRRVTRHARRRVRRGRGGVRGRLPGGNGAHHVARAGRLRRRRVPRLDRAGRRRGRARALPPNLGTHLPARAAVGPHEHGSLPWPCSQSHPPAAAVSSRKWQMTNGHARFHLMNRTPKSAPISRFPTKPPQPWYRW